MSLGAAMFAVARVRRARRARIQDALGDVRVGVGLGLAVGVPLGLFAAFGDRKTPDGLVPLLMPVLVLFAVALPGLVAGAAYAAYALLRSLVRALASPLWWLRYLRERELEALLLRDGRVSARWWKDSPLRRRAVQRLLALDADLVESDGVLRPLGALPDTCPNCGAPLDQPGPGLRRCHYCEYDRYDPAPEPSARWKQARLDGPREIGQRVRAKHPDFDRDRARALWLIIISVVLDLVVGLLFALGVRGGLGVVGVSGMLAALPGAYYALTCAWRWGSTALRDWPKIHRERHQAHDEILRLTGEAGAIGLDELASHLHVERGWLDGEVSALLAEGELPVYLDEERQRLVSRFCEGVDSRCPQCGGYAVPEPRGLVCQHCGALVLALHSTSRPRSTPVGPTAPKPLSQLGVRADAKRDGASLWLGVADRKARAGETITAHLGVTVDNARRCDAVRLRLMRGLSDVDTKGEETQCFAEHELLQNAEVLDTLEATQEVRLPVDNISWKGELVHIGWWLSAKLLPDGPYVTVDLDVEPAVADPARDSVLAANFVAARRTEKVEDLRSMLVMAVLFLLPSLLVLGLTVAAAIDLVHGRHRNFCLGFLALVALGIVVCARRAWDALTRWHRTRRVDATIIVPPYLRQREPARLRVHLRGPIRSARWDLANLQWAKRAKAYTWARGDLTVEPYQAITLDGLEAAPAPVKGEHRSIDWALRVHLEATDGSKRTVSKPVVVLPVVSPNCSSETSRGRGRT